VYDEPVVRVGYLLALGCVLASAQSQPKDELLEAARTAAQSYTADLPNYVVQQVTTRYRRVTLAATGWEAVNTQTAEVAYVNGREEYRGVRESLPGPRAELVASTRGEFATTLRDVFSAKAAAQFTRSGSGRVAGRQAAKYDFTVAEPNSQWDIVGPAGNAYRTAYRGTLWIDWKTRRVLRLEQETLSLPPAFPVRSVQTTLEYGFVAIGERRYLLPVHCVHVACERFGNSCARNTIEFRKYRKFTAESEIKFGP
jgi:hypothetical protein